MPSQRGAEGVEDVSTAFDLLKDAYRRGVLYALEVDDPVLVTDVARRIAIWQDADANIRTIETSLVHCHLPKLAEAGVVEYDRDEGTIELADATTDLDPLLEQACKHDSDLFRAVNTTDVERLESTDVERLE